MFEDFHQHRQIAKWIITVFTICILIFLGVRYIEGILSVLIQIFQLFKTLFIGIILALILNVPMTAIQKYLFPKRPAHRARRPLAILLTLLFAALLLVWIAFLILPELLDAIALLSQVLLGGLDTLETIHWQDIPLGQYLSQLPIDYTAIRDRILQWSSTDQLIDRFQTMAGKLMTLFIGLIFSIYILAQKEQLKNQVIRLIQVWLPRRIGRILLYVTDVSCQTFRQFISGQAIEAVILGTLCMLGMGILNIPYAPTIGALVGVTALLPMVGAFIGIIVGAIIIFTVNPIKALIFVIFLTLLQQLENNLIYPKVVGRKIHLPAIWVLAAVTVGGELAGPVGMFLGVPAASTAYALLREATNRFSRKKERMQN